MDGQSPELAARSALVDRWLPHRLTSGAVILSSTHKITVLLLLEWHSFIPPLRLHCWVAQNGTSTLEGRKERGHGGSFVLNAFFFFPSGCYLPSLLTLCSTRLYSLLLFFFPLLTTMTMNHIEMGKIRAKHRVFLVIIWLGSGRLFGICILWVWVGEECNASKLKGKLCIKLRDGWGHCLAR